MHSKILLSKTIKSIFSIYLKIKIAEIIIIAKRYMEFFQLNKDYMVGDPEHIE